MSHVFQLSDEQYAELAAYAARQKQTPETLFQRWVDEMTQHTEALTSAGRIKQTCQEGREGREEGPLNHPLLQVAGMFAIGKPGWADRHDEYLAEAYLEDHTNKE